MSMIYQMQLCQSKSDVGYTLDKSHVGLISDFVKSYRRIPSDKKKSIPLTGLGINDTILIEAILIILT